MQCLLPDFGDLIVMRIMMTNVIGAIVRGHDSIILPHVGPHWHAIGRTSRRLSRFLYYAMTKLVICIRRRVSCIANHVAPGAEVHALRDIACFLRIVTATTTKTMVGGITMDVLITLHGKIHVDAAQVLHTCRAGMILSQPTCKRTPSKHARQSYQFLTAQASQATR